LAQAAQPRAGWQAAQAQAREQLGAAVMSVGNIRAALE
jgi:hypothetical protein